MLVDTKTAASILGVSTTRVRLLLKEKRIEGAYKIGKFWVIPLTRGIPTVTKGTRGPVATFKYGRIPASSIIRINRQVIDKNHKQNELEPIITVKQGKENIYGHQVEINGPCRIIYNPFETKYGARVWIETSSEVETILKDEQEMIDELTLVAA